ncbi:hypothetical protein D9756_008512 [Leucocoprinus leucothites]|uniref:Uncharacterized protein n=1 Tax=Leucocoprinus leucothites TaxID=201217 RepID=A0A8H5FVJ0_9AGAR|nr:hypothetical protein D9756_008512 [Leucoagaricus leucothites]
MYLTTNLDIWTEFLQFFRLSSLDYLGSNQESAAAESLLNPALAEPWRSLSTLEYVTQIYDAPPEPESPGESAFKYEEEGGYWYQRTYTLAHPARTIRESVPPMPQPKRPVPPPRICSSSYDLSTIPSHIPLY